MADKFASDSKFEIATVCDCIFCDSLANYADLHVSIALCEHSYRKKEFCWFNGILTKFR